MKKLTILITILLLIALPINSYAVWVTANKVSVTWDPNDTSLLDTDERLVYRVYIANLKTDPEKINPSMIGETEETTMLATFVDKGKFLAGVKAVLQVLGEDGVTWEDVAESEMSWSDDPTVTKDGIIFKIRYYPAPNKPAGLHAG